MRNFSPALRTGLCCLLLGLLVGGGPGCRRDATSPIELLGARYLLPVDGVVRPHFDGRFPPRWRLPARTTGRIVVERRDPTEGWISLSARTEVFEARTLVKLVAVPPEGDHEVRLRRGDDVIWQSHLRWVPRPSEHPAILGLEEVRASNLEAAAAALAQLTEAEEPTVRFAGYLTQGRWAWSQSVEAAGAAWARGFRDPVLAAASPRSAGYLRGSYLYTLIQTNRLDEAERFIEASIPHWAHSGTRHARIDLLQQRAHLALERGRRVQALGLYRASIAASIELGEEDIRRTASTMTSVILADLGRYAEALQAAHWALSRAPSPRHQVVSWTDVLWCKLLGTLAGELDFSLADLAAEHEAAYSVATGVAAPSDRVALASAAAYIALLRDDPRQAETWLAEIPFDRDAELGHMRWFARLTAARLRLAQGALSEAETLLEGILRDTRSTRDEDDAVRVQARHLRGALFARRGDAARARADLETAWKDSLRVARGMGLLGARGHYLRAEGRPSVDLARARADAADGWGALEVLEASLYEGWAALVVDGAVDDEPERFAALADARATLRARQADGCAMGPATRRAGCEASLQAAAAAVETALAEYYAGLRIPARVDLPTRLRGLQRDLDTGQGVLVSLAAEGDAQSVLLTAEGLTVVEGSAPWAELAPAMSRLSSLAVAGALDPSEVVAPGAELPWAARLALHRWPSAVWSAPRATSFTAPARVFADPTSDLQKARQGTLTLAETLGAETLVGPAVTRAAVLEAFGRQSKLILISGHAVARAFDRTTTRIRLADGAIDIQDLTSGRARAELVVLNGCATGGHAQGYGVSLPSALLLQGSHAVLATVEPVADVDATRFLARFFAAGGRTAPRNAFREAVRASMEAEDPVWRHYRLWAR